MRRLHLARALGPPRLAILPVAALIAAGCGTAIPPNNGHQAAVEVTNSTLGRFLADGEGHTLYLFKRDEGGESYCNGACASVWPPFETDGKPRGMAGLPASSLGTIKRDDGDLQVTYRGHPLYFYAADASAAGKTKGEDVKQFGASWYVLGTNGKAVEPEGDSGHSHGGNDNGSSGGGGGYS